MNDKYKSAALHELNTAIDSLYKLEGYNIDLNTLMRDNNGEYENTFFDMAEMLTKIRSIVFGETVDWKSVEIKLKEDDKHFKNSGDVGV